MNSYEIKQKFIDFFINKNHKRISNASLIPAETDASVIFTNSGMHPLVPYLTGEIHPMGIRLVNTQRCIRLVDIENVGVRQRSNTFFEMLGAWSLGDYWKEEILNWTMDFLVGELGLDPKRIHPTVFVGNQYAPRDEESIEILKKIFKEKYNIDADVGEGFDDGGNSTRIVMLGEDNFWPGYPKKGHAGPCGPTCEFYYDRGGGKDADERYMEICNDVFMAYYADKEGNLSELSQRNIDLGWGLERLTALMSNLQENGDLSLTSSVFETNAFAEEKEWLLEKIFALKNPTGTYEENLQLALTEYFANFDLRSPVRIILDHIRASIMIISDGVEPSNKDRGYVLRRLIRRSMGYGKKFTLTVEDYISLGNMFIEKLSQDEDYAFIQGRKEETLDILRTELEKFDDVLEKGIRELNKESGSIISGEKAFFLKESMGLPIEVTVQIAEDSGKKVDIEKYEQLLKEHQEVSKAGSEKKFAGGLGDHSPESIRFHTCAHLFLAAARNILGKEVHQKGQNITQERLRYDFNYPNPLTKDQIQSIEDWVNDKLEKHMKVDFIEMSLEEAKQKGAEGVFEEKYKTLDKVKVYRIYSEGNEMNPVSIELCGGPHVSNTSEIQNFGKFKIIKEESSGSGIRRIKAILI